MKRSRISSRNKALPSRVPSASMTAAAALLGAVLHGRYEVQRELGRGGMATVYLADDPKHGRQVAIKVLHPELAAVLGAERFLKEIEIAAGLTHPHILPLHDSGEADGLLYYVMPYLDGESLRAKLDREKQLSTDEAIEIAKRFGAEESARFVNGVLDGFVKRDRKGA